MPGGFILITDTDGIRYAVRPQSIGIIHDTDECRDETLIQVTAVTSSAFRARSMRCSAGSRDDQVVGLWRRGDPCLNHALAILPFSTS